MLMPGDARGVPLTSNTLCICAYADNLGLLLNAHMRLSIMIACGMRFSHRCNGKFWLAVHMHAMK